MAPWAICPRPISCNCFERRASGCCQAARDVVYCQWYCRILPNGNRGFRRGGSGGIHGGLGKEWASPTLSLLSGIFCSGSFGDLGWRSGCPDTDGGGGATVTEPLGEEETVKRQEVEAWVREAVEALLAQPADGIAGDIELVDVTFRPEGGRRILRVTLDRPGGITLDDCQAVSNALSALLDEEDPIPYSYYLEVSSPGVDRPLVREEDYRRFAGQQVKVSTYAPIDGRKNWQGELIGLTDGQVRLMVDQQLVSIPYEMVARARLVPQW